MSAAYMIAIYVVRSATGIRLVSEFLKIIRFVF